MLAIRVMVVQYVGDAMNEYNIRAYSGNPEYAE
jgi:hypothetical protein